MTRLRRVLLVTIAVASVPACGTIGPEGAFVPSASYRMLACEDVPGLPGYCAVGMVSMNHIGYSLTLLSPRAPDATRPPDATWPTVAVRPTAGGATDR